MLCLSLQIESCCGASISDTARDMVTLAKKLDLCVHAKVNGAPMMAFPTSVAEDVEKAWRHMSKLPPTKWLSDL